jgi:micrococcal nuclease
MIEAVIALLLAFIALVLLSGEPSGSHSLNDDLTGRVRYVVDGDSLYIHSHSEQIRLWGVNTPEEGEAGYMAAKSFLERTAKGQTITCQQMHVDKYGRTVGRCYLPNGRDIGGLLIEQGLAKEMLGFSKGYYSRLRK